MARFLLLILVSVVLAMTGLIQLAGLAGADKNSPAASANEPTITVDFGVLRRGESAEHRCWLVNPSKTPIEISRFKTSCECVSVTSEREIIAPGERVLLKIRFDGTHDSEFTGSLGVSVGVKGPRGESLGQITADVEVIDVGVALP